MEIPGRVSLYCSLVDAKGTPAKLIAVSPEGYFHLEVTIKGRQHTMFVPVAQAALYFTEPEPEVDNEPAFEVER